MQTVVMERLITDTALVLLTLGGSYYFVRFRLAKRAVRNATTEKNSALEETARERQYRYAAEERLEAVHEHVGTMLEGTPYKAPSRMWRLKGFGWLVGLVTGAGTAARVAPASGGVATTTVTAKVAALTGFAAAVLATGTITYAVNIMHEPTVRPPTTATAAAPPKVPRQQALPAPSGSATTPAEAPVAATGTAPAATTTPTIPPTTTTAAPATPTPARATSTTTPTTTVTTTTTPTTTVAATTDPTVEATTTPVPTVPSADPAPDPAGNGNGNGKGHKPPKDAAPHILCSGLPLLSELLGPC